MNTFANRLKELRQEFSLTQKQLAEQLNYTQSNICEWEKGTVEPKASALNALALRFNVSTDFLIGRSDDFGNVTVQSVAPTPTEEERELLALFSKMTHSQKIRFVAYGEGLIGAPLSRKKT